MFSDLLYIVVSKGCGPVILISFLIQMLSFFVYILLWSLFFFLLVDSASDYIISCGLM